ncbi:MAG: hypothetical protein PHE73_04170 [Sulfurovaceae bacterium]|nr:hypothetical protein [Sulfurovaceae bacterium]
MSSSLDRLKALSGKLEEKLNVKESLFDDDFAEQHAIATNVIEKNPNLQSESGVIAEDKENRSYNMQRLTMLFNELKINEKCSKFDDIFSYKAMNLAGIGLKDDDFGEVRDGKYIQIIAISYESDGDSEKKKAKNISLGYFGKGNELNISKKHSIIEFILRWRYEKGFQNLDNYKHLLEKLETASKATSANN